MVVEKTLETCEKIPFSVYSQVCETETAEYLGKCSRKLQRKTKSKEQHNPGEPVKASGPFQQINNNTINTTTNY